MLGIYLHIPFCAAICNYCNFNRGLFDEGLKARYVDALIGEILGHRATCGRQPSEADTIYFGGGTPSLLSGDDVRRIVEACRGTWNVASDAEITLEANPETVTVERLAAYREAGVNRLSYGVQSFRDSELRRLARAHSAERAREAFAQARAAGFDNISLDLMMWLPAQRVEEWLESVDQAIALAPEHLSLYMLEVYPNAPLRDLMARGAWSQAPDDDVAAMYVVSMERLEDAGYLQYEISNVSRPGRQSRHNLKYWTDGAWLGLGCGAHSTAGGARWRNVSSTEDYIGRIGSRQSPIAEKRCLTTDERLADALFTGLRLTQGVDVVAVNRRYGTDVWRRYGADLSTFIELGLLDVSERRWRLTREGLLLAHEVMAVFV